MIMSNPAKLSTTWSVAPVVSLRQLSCL